MKELIAQYCKELRLGKSIVENYQKIQAETNEEFLLKLLKLEIENRRVSRKNRYLKQTNFEVMKTFEGYSFENVQIPKSITLEELQEGRFLEKKENLILYGPVGTGKTHMATAIGIAACNREKKVRFYRTATLVNELVEAKSNGTLKRFLKTLRKTDLLICDEWGYIPLDREGAQLLFQVIAERYERNSVIITTNLEFSKWNGIFYDEKLTSAIIDRLIHHCHLLVFTGKSYRLEHSSIKA
ncbi:IS21-like element ISKol3 family helper ATPase IstB [Kosmotoga olearia]|uniref:IstB domain protein ATP-binding protein n=1 Tax=Kosmotoga olearia (strain ATCC BAA-1733 / DSM 21960 / TBF 19.5.1) TaxID=521045 RepID=C5CDB1_KOSOT|nr:IS21-like element ISKol3 family helper ATPase IstB [Kosmotoga olearia]ACR79974.1 IstB domain protein ATP-binding protein [Kosmotoga olearia TBF 19.5.1]